MSQGLRYISSIIANQAHGDLLACNADDFTDAERPVFDFVRTHYRRHRELPEARTVQEETATRLPSATEALAYYRDAFAGRADFHVFQDAYSRLRERARDANTLDGMTEVRSIVGRLNRDLGQRITRTRNVQSMDAAMQEVIRGLDQTRGYGGITGIETGWPQYDSITGGYQNTDLITIVGRMALGKTYVLLRQADAAHRAGENVLFVTTEMGTEQIARRYMAINQGVNPTALKKNQLSTHVERRLREFATSMVGADRFKIFSVGMKEKVNAIEAYIQEFGPTVVFIDGAYLLRPSEGPKNMNRIERITEVFNELKALNNEVHLPLIATSQFNRQAGKGGKDGSLETVAFSDAISMNSSLVVALKDGPTENPRESREMNFMKGREGEEGSVYIHFRFAPPNFDEFTPDLGNIGAGEDSANDESPYNWTA
jgi:replicative DNA helicase